VHLLDNHDVVLGVKTVAPRTVVRRSDVVTLIPAAQRRDRHTKPFGDHTDGVLRQVPIVVLATALAF
jgi:hypothetical protein